MSIPLAMSPVGYDTWVTELKRALYDYLGQTGIEVEYLSTEKKLVINTDKVSEEEYAGVANIATEYMPTGITLEQYNYIVPFIRLDYLESTGTQYIDTGIKLSNESEVRLSVYYEGGTTIRSLYGAMDGTTARFYSLLPHIADTGYFYSYFYTPGNYNGIRIYPPCFAQITQNKTGFYLNEKFNPNAQALTEFVTSSAYLFSHNIYGGEGRGTPFIGRIYSFAISRNGVQQLNFIPCLDNTGKPCMYDTLTGTPFYNQGTGDDFDFGAKYTNELQFSKALSMLPANSTYRIFKVSVPEEVLASPLIQKLMQKCQTEKKWIIQTIN